MNKATSDEISDCFRLDTTMKHSQLQKLYICYQKGFMTESNHAHSEMFITDSYLHDTARKGQYKIL